MNRISAAITRVQAKLDTISADERAKLDASMAVDPGDHFAYQEQQARAHAMGKLSADEAMVIYTALGEVGSESNGGWAQGTDLATKVVVTQVIGELLRAKLARAS